MEELKKSS